MILQRYPLGETKFEVLRTKFTYRDGEEKVPREKVPRVPHNRGTFAVRGTFPMDPVSHGLLVVQVRDVLFGG